MTHSEHVVSERSASTMVRPNTILYSRILAMDGVAIMCGCAPLIIPAGARHRADRLRQAIAGKRALMSRRRCFVSAAKLREAYLDIADRLYHPRMPELQNTDGDPLLQTLHFDLRCTPGAAFDHLRSLALDRARSNTSEESDLCSGRNGGHLQAVRFDWLRRGNAKRKRTGTTRYSATSRINGGRLTAQVEFAAPRRSDIRAEVEQRLGADAVYRTAVIEWIEKLSEERRNRPETAKERREREEDERLNALPEVQEHLRAMAAEHWRHWLDGEIPALRHRTPRQASRTPEGRAAARGPAAGVRRARRQRSRLAVPARRRRAAQGARPRPVSTAAGRWLPIRVHL